MGSSPYNYRWDLALILQNSRDLALILHKHALLNKMYLLLGEVFEDGGCVTERTVNYSQVT